MRERESYSQTNILAVLYPVVIAPVGHMPSIRKSAAGRARRSRDCAHHSRERVAGRRSRERFAGLVDLTNVCGDPVPA